MINKMEVLVMRFNFINTPLPPYETIERTKREIKKELEKTIYTITKMPKGSIEIMPGIHVGCWDLILPVFLTGLQHLGSIASILSLPQSLNYLYERCEESLKKFTGGRNTAKDFPGFIKTNLGVYDSMKYCIEKMTENTSFLNIASEIIIKDFIQLCKQEAVNSRDDVERIIKDIKTIDLSSSISNLGVNFDNVEARVKSYLSVHSII